MPQAGAIDAGGLQLHGETQQITGREHVDDKLKRQVNVQLEYVEGMLAKNSRTMDGLNRVRASTGEDRWEQQRTECLKERENYLRRREVLREKEHNLQMGNPRRIDQEDTVWMPFLIGVIVLWKLLTRPPKAEE